jgi:hypothetical protein
VTNPDGSNQVLLSNLLDEGGHQNDLNAHWFPGTDTIVFRAMGDKKTQYYIIQPDGNGLKAVTNSRVGALNILPVLYNEGIFWEEGRQDRSGIYSYGWHWSKLDGSETKKLDWLGPKISPDGRFVIDTTTIEMGSGNYCSFCGFTISAIDGSNPVTIKSTDIVKDWDGQYPPMISGYIWSPDSTKLLVQLGFCDPVCDISKHYIVSSSGELLSEVPPGSENFRIDNSYPSLSPDGKQYIFSNWVRDDSNNYVGDKLYSFDFESMQIEEVDGSFTKDVSISNYFWLPATGP